MTIKAARCWHSSTSKTHGIHPFPQIAFRSGAAASLRAQHGCCRASLWQTSRWDATRWPHSRGYRARCAFSCRSCAWHKTEREEVKSAWCEPTVSGVAEKANVIVLKWSLWTCTRPCFINPMSRSTCRAQEHSKGCFIDVIAIWYIQDIFKFNNKINYLLPCVWNSYLMYLMQCKVKGHWREQFSLLACWEGSLWGMPHDLTTFSELIF